MLDPRDLYEEHFEVSDLLRARGEGSQVGPVMVISLKGIADAGHITDVVNQHLLDIGEPERVVTFDHDRLVDYHAKRPMLTFDAARWVDYHGPSIALDVVRDSEGTQFLLLHGSEPDRYWDAFVEAVVNLVAEFNVSLVLGVSGIPMGVPHTRPQGAIMHATREGLIDEDKAWSGNMQVPATVANVINFALGLSERDAVGIAVHVPHYLAQSQYTPAAIAGLTRLEALSGLELAVEGLASAAQEAVDEVDRQASKSQDISEMIRGLENQYDAFMAAHPEESLLAHVTRIPTADEIGAEFEKFLSRMDKPGAEANGYESGPFDSSAFDAKGAGRSRPARPIVDVSPEDSDESSDGEELE